jgi:hypothetical protein
MYAFWFGETEVDQDLRENDVFGAFDDTGISASAEDRTIDRLPLLATRIHRRAPR